MAYRVVEARPGGACMVSYRRTGAGFSKRSPHEVLRYAGLPGKPWPHSSFHRDVRAGLVPHDWAGDVGDLGEFGERRP